MNIGGYFMKLILGCVATLLATTAWSDEFTAQSKVSKVLASPSGGIITRNVSLAVPAGQHTITISGLPTVDGEIGNGIDFPAGSGLTLVAASAKEALSQEPMYRKTAQYRTLKQAVESAQRALHAHQSIESAQQAVVEASQVRLTFVKQFANGASTVLSLDQLSDPQLITNLTTQLGDEAAKAVTQAAEAQRQLQTLNEKGQELRVAVSRAQEQLDEFVPQERNEMVVTLDIDAQEPFTGEIELRHLASEISWQLLSDIELTQSKSKGALRIEQQAILTQETDEDWIGVNVTLSTADLMRQVGVDLPRSMIRRLYDPSKKSLRKVIRNESMSADMAVGVEPMIAEAPPRMTAVSLAGQTQLFDMKIPLDVRSFESTTVIPLQEINMEVDLYARANTRHEGAYMYADITNETGGRILPSVASLYRDGQFFGELNLPEIVAGSEYSLQLGVIDGLLVDHNVIKKEDGDRGLLSSSQIAESRFETVVTSLLDYDMPFKLYGNMPVTESEDLTIKEYATPQISEREIDGRRGVVGWYFDLSAKQSQKIEYGYDLSWPTGMSVE
jgi:uncharacterized protein (TIGR02231 family)